jgi:hypothetical protein
MATYGTFVDNVSLKAVEVNDFLVWKSFTPVLKQNVTVQTRTFQRVAEYAQVNKLIVVIFSLRIDSSGTANNSIEINLPVTASSASMRVIGRFTFRDQSATDDILAVPVLNSTTTFRFLANAGTSLTSYVGLTGAPGLTLAIDDSINGYLMYEAA